MRFACIVPSVLVREGMLYLEENNFFTIACFIVYLFYIYICLYNKIAIVMGEIMSAHILAAGRSTYLPTTVSLSSAVLKCTI
jgi:hypothetical protein